MLWVVELSEISLMNVRVRVCVCICVFSSNRLTQNDSLFVQCPCLFFLPPSNSGPSSVTFSLSVLSLSHVGMGPCPFLTAPCVLGRAVRNRSFPHLTSCGVTNSSASPWKALSAHLFLPVPLFWKHPHFPARKSCPVSGWGGRPPLVPGQVGQPVCGLH